MQIQQLSKTAISEQEVFKGAARSSGPRELRLALSLRGGVSLAVWIGGAVAELDRLRRASKEQDTASDGIDGVYKQLCQLANYDNVSIDVITGASAGGLNGVLYTASLVYGFDFDEIAQIWVTSTDIEALSRETSGGGGQASSLLEGDGYFLELVRQKLTSLVENGTGELSLDDTDPRLELLLTATLADPVRVRFSIDRFADIVDNSRAAFFHFGHLGEVGGPYSDFGALGDVGARTKSIAQLSLAARASSSFPVAFEPATVGGHDRVEIQDMFSEDVGDGVEVIDGGTLDNIPVAKAIEAIAAAPAQGPTKRWLVYLHPSPDVEGERASKGKGLRSVISNMKRAANAAISQESLIEDLMELERHNVAVDEHQAARDALIAGAISAELTPNDILNGGWTDEATSNWVTVEASRILNLAENPRAAVINHTVTSTAIPERWQSSEYRMLREQLFDALQDAVSESGERPQVLDLMATTSTLIGWANALQGVELDASGLEKTSTAKRKLYEVRLVLETLTHIWEAAWIANTGGLYPGLENLAQRIRGWHIHALRCSEWAQPSFWDPVLTAINDGPEVGVATSSRTNTELHNALYRLAQDAQDKMSERHPISHQLWELLTTIADELSGVTAQVSAEDPVDVKWIRNAEASRESLQSLAVLLSPQVSRTALSFSRIDFARLSGANETALEEFFGDDPLDALAKLVGSELANFGAFFTAKGRANDWMWGRIDAAKTIIDLILAGWQPPDDVDDDELNARVDQAVEDIRAIITHPFSGANDKAGWNDWTGKLWNAETSILVRKEVCEYFGGAFTDEHCSNSTTPCQDELTVTKKLLTRRIQTEILARHQPWVEEIKPTHVDAPGIGDAPATHRELIELTKQPAPTIRDFKIPDSISPIRWSSIGMRLGLVAWRALTGRFWGTVLFVFKPLYLYVLAIAVQPRRALFSGMIGFGALAVGDWEGGPMAVDALWSDTTPDPKASWQRIVAWVIVLFSFVIYVVIERHRRKKELKVGSERGKRDYYLFGRGTLATAVLIGVTTSIWIGWVLPPGVVVMAGLLISAVLFTFMRPEIHVMACAAVVGVYLLWAWWSPNEMSRGWWAFVGYTTVTYLLTLAISIFDVFRPRPRPKSFVPPRR